MFTNKRVTSQGTPLPYHQPTMTFNPEAVEAVAFDSYGTIVDVMAVAEPLSEYMDSPEVVAIL